jgi:hypothetical protein
VVALDLKEVILEEAKVEVMIESVLTAARHLVTMLRAATAVVTAHEIVLVIVPATADVSSHGPVGLTMTDPQLLLVVAVVEVAVAQTGMK